MRIFPFLFCSLLLAACAQVESDGDALTADDSTTPPQSDASAAPDVRPFAYTGEVMAVMEGAGCGYSAPGTTDDSSLFASSTDAVIRVGDKIEVLKLVREGKANDSTTELRYENATYRVDLRTQVDSMMEGGVAEHGR